jgi:hypothetical protein
LGVCTNNGTTYSVNYVLSPGSVLTRVPAVGTIGTNVITGIPAGTNITLIATNASCNKKDSIIIISPNCRIIPDLTPVIELPDNTFASGQTKNAVLYLEEILGGSTLPGTAVFRVRIPGGYAFNAFNPNLTSITPSGGNPQSVSNTDWSVLSQSPTQITLKAKAGVSIEAFGVVFLGVTLTRTTSVTQAVANMSIGIIADPTNSEYDSIVPNNTFSRIIISQ